MWRIHSGKRGQNTAEYAILFAIIIGAVMAMQTYVKRGLQKGIQHNLDSKLNNNLVGSKQYEPYYLKSQYTTTTSYTDTGISDTENITSGGQVERVYGSKTSARSGNQTIEDTAHGEQSR